MKPSEIWDKPSKEYLKAVESKTLGYNLKKSECCKAPVIVVGRTTLHYECRCCGEPCDLYFKNEIYETTNDN